MGFASVYIALESQISTGSLSYAVFFFCLYLVAHIVARFAARVRTYPVHGRSLMDSRQSGMRHSAVKNPFMRSTKASVVCALTGRAAGISVTIDP